MKNDSLTQLDSELPEQISEILQASSDDQTDESSLKARSFLDKAWSRYRNWLVSKGLSPELIDPIETKVKEHLEGYAARICISRGDLKFDTKVDLSYAGLERFDTQRSVLGALLHDQSILLSNCDGRKKGGRHLAATFARLSSEWSEGSFFDGLGEHEFGFPRKVLKGCYLYLTNLDSDLY